MTRDELLRHALTTGVVTRWHWFRYHFEPYLTGNTHPFVEDLIATLLATDARIPGYATQMIDRLASYGGREKHLDHYDQLLSQLAEIFVVAQTVRGEWGAEASFRSEPGAADGRVNPEVVVELSDASFGIEVKAPKIHLLKAMRTPGEQLLARMPFDFDADATKPRDNPVKDFLISANTKFEELSRSHPGSTGILVIVWDDYVQEPVAALLSEWSGLFTEKSFAKDAAGERLRFPFVDGVVLVRQLHQFYLALKNAQLDDGFTNAFDYGTPATFPPKVLVQNPDARRAVPPSVVKALQLKPMEQVMHFAEYSTREFIRWLVVPPEPG